MANVFSGARGAVRVYRMGRVDYSAVGADDTLDNLLTVSTFCTRMRLQNVGANNMWLNWNTAAVADQCVKIAAGDHVVLDNERDNLLLYHLSAPVATVAAAIMEY